MELLERGIERSGHEAGNTSFARIRFDEVGACSMRDASGLCRIHQRFGHEALFEVCATYPRYASAVDDDVELFGTLACPEVARLALLADDAFELAHLTLDEPPRVLRNRFRTDEPYYRSFKPVRAALVRLVSEPGYALSEKLFVLLWIADKLKGVLHRGCGEVPATELDRALGALSDPAVLGVVVASFRALSLDGNLAFSVVVASLRPPPEARRGAQTEGFDEIWTGVVARCGAALAPGAAPSEQELRQAFSRYAALRAQLPAAVDARVDLCLARYAVNYLLTTPYMLSQSVFEYACDLVVLVASLRFLLSTALAGAERTDAEVDAQIVRVTYSFVRAVEHSDVPTVLRRALRHQGLDGLAHAVGFLALWRPGAG